MSLSLDELYDELETPSEEQREELKRHLDTVARKTTEILHHLQNDHQNMALPSNSTKTLKEKRKEYKKRLEEELTNVLQRHQREMAQGLRVKKSKDFLKDLDQFFAIVDEDAFPQTYGIRSSSKFSPKPTTQNKPKPEASPEPTVHDKPKPETSPKQTLHDEPKPKPSPEPIVQDEPKPQTSLEPIVHDEPRPDTSPKSHCP
nr:PREDICTED: pinin-like [Latimeria chalumnae]|eukprot:XP_006009589.1 PREDICTED: pinin-like [Latimeria chalumnae]